MKGKKWIISIVSAVLAVTSIVVPQLYEANKISAAELEKIVYHPLNQLTGAEIKDTAQIVRSSEYGSPEITFPEIKLQEPNKQKVWNWDDTGGPNLPRQASFSAVKGGKAYEGIVDLDKDKVIQWKEITQGWPILSDTVTKEVQELVKADPLVKEALAKRGLTDYTKLSFGVSPLGDYGPDHTPAGSRLFVSTMRFIVGEGNNYAHPVSGLAALVDLNAKKVLEVKDFDQPPVPMQPAGYDKVEKSKRTDDLKPLLITQPKGASFTAKGNTVEWQNWKFHFRLDPRVGPIVSTISFDDNGSKRKIMYEGYLGGMMVPYGDPNPDWFFKIFMDSGEYGVGFYTRPLKIGGDVPQNATLFDSVVNDDKGEFKLIEDSIALFERYADPDWTHNSTVTGVQSRERRELVLRSIATIGNYDYILDWVFQQNGSIKLNIGATGIGQIRGVRSETIQDKTAEKDTRNGTLVDANTVAVNHQHIFNYRLDMDVDGTTNSVGEIVTQAVPVNNGGPARSEMINVSKTYKKEQDAIQKFDADKIILVTSPDMKNEQGYPTGYQMIAYAGGTHPFAEEPLFVENDYVLKRAEFINNHIWVTPYKENELYSEGKYTTHNTDTGLGMWTKQNRPIENKDTVVWLTTGTTHVMRAEEWPMMPTEWVSTMIKPFNFFDKTPTLDLPTVEDVMATE